MAKNKIEIEIVGKLRLSHDAGLEAVWDDRFRRDYSEHEESREEALPRALEREWPGLGKYPEDPEPYRAQEQERVIRAVRSGSLRLRGKEDEGRAGGLQREQDKWWEDWHRAQAAYIRALHASPEYQKAATDFVRMQWQEPQPWRHLWIYRHKILSVASRKPDSLRDTSKDAVLVKHYVLRQDQEFDKIRRQVETLENLDKMGGVSREPIPKSVRIFVWQRDKGQCVKCASREKLEFDHIIPVISGGSSTERNVQLLCESCNRSKGATI